MFIAPNKNLTLTNGFLAHQARRPPPHLSVQFSNHTMLHPPNPNDAGFSPFIAEDGIQARGGAVVEGVGGGQD
jgi:hypothetical protein